RPPDPEPRDDRPHDCGTRPMTLPTKARLMPSPLRLLLVTLLGSAAIPAMAQERLTVDMASDTGAFHGGASGTLYGLYDARLPHPNLVEGIGLRTVSTKAQDGPQHPGAD